MLGMAVRARVSSIAQVEQHSPAGLAGLLAFLLLLLPGLTSCGGAGEDGAPSPIGGPGGDGGDPDPHDDDDEEEGPPDLGDLEGFGVWPGSESLSANVGRLGGYVGYRNTPRLARISASAVSPGSLYRRPWFVSEPQSGIYIGEDFAMAKEEGMKPWLHCVGTPIWLSPHPELTENEFDTGLPGYARYMPTDPLAWADLVLDFINNMQTEHGLVPSYIELWNEVERPEWYSGTLAEFLNFYTTVSRRIHSVRPGIKIGGPGLAGYSSAMGGTESVLLALIRHADQTSAPLDFVSWHHYAPGNEILFSDMPDVARDLAASLGMTDLKAIISEWNIYPSAQGMVGPEFDGSHCAANLAGFLTTALASRLDANLFFMDVDEDNDPGITDLAGVSLGAMTLRGIKKPVFRVLDVIHQMFQEEILPIYRPVEDEFNLQVLAARNGEQTRIIVSNDVVTPLWVFANRSRQFGMDPAWLYALWIAAGGSQADLQDLLDAGLTLQQATDLLSFLPEVYAALHRTENPRDAVVTILGEKDFSVTRVIRFDSVNNAPANHLAGLMPELLQVEDNATWEAAVAVSDYLETWGYYYTAAELAEIPQSMFLDWAAGEGIAYGVAVTALKLTRDTLRDERLASASFLNSQPETEIQVQSAAAAGITVDGRKLRFQLDPDALVVIVIQH
jgi:hypothetical protein